MEALLNTLVDLGVIGSTALLVWGFVLVAMLRFGGGDSRRAARSAHTPQAEAPALRPGQVAPIEEREGTPVELRRAA